ncbi:MAG: winged helix-turn-helix transcriptional regulator [Methanobacteriota archaeon]
MDFNKTELRVVRTVTLNPGISIEDVSGKMRLSEPRVYAVVQALRQKGIVKTEKRYNMRLYPSGSPLSTQLSRILRSQREGIAEEALSGKRLSILKTLYRGSKRVEEIARKAGLSDKRVYHYLFWFESFGLVRNVKGRYVLMKNHPLYGSLELLFSKPASIPAEVEQDAHVSWAGKGEYIVHTSRPEEYRRNLPSNISAASTASSAVDDYGIHVIPPDTTLYVAGKDSDTIKRAKKSGRMPLEDLIIHLLLDNPHDEETKRYIRWLIIKHENKLDFKLLKKKAVKYNLQKTIESLQYDLKPILKRR